MDRTNELIEAIKAGDESKVSGLIAAEPRLADATAPAGVPVTMLAMYHGQRAIAQKLVAAKRTLSLFEAAAFGRMDALTAAISADGGAARAFSEDGFTALHFAAFFAQSAAARALVVAGADVNAVARNSFKVAPLHSAVSSSDVETVRLLIEHGADVNAPQQQGFTALQAAAGHGMMEILDLLLAAGADVHAKSDDGKTALAMALEKSQPAAAARLRAAGAAS